MIEYSIPCKFALDNLWFSYRGDIFKGQGFMEWDPDDGFQIDALLDKSFAPVNSLKTFGQIFINDKNDAFTIWLKIKGFGTAVAPNVFPLAQKKSFIPDNHLSINVERAIFFFKWPRDVRKETDWWSGSTAFLTDREFEFPYSLQHETSIAGQLIKSDSKIGFSYEDGSNCSLSGQYLSDKIFELNWNLSKSCWSKTDAWNFGEAARRALSIVFAQTVWIGNSKITKENREIFDFRKKGRQKL